MTVLRAGRFEYTFETDWDVLAYDDARYYKKNVRMIAGGTKGVDFVAYDPSRRTAWLIEVTDYARHGVTKRSDLIRESAAKFRDTLAGLVGMRLGAGTQYREVAARVSCEAERVAFVLHVEFPTSGPTLERGAGDHRSLEAKFRRAGESGMLRDIRVVEARTTMPWFVATG